MKSISKGAMGSNSGGLATATTGYEPMRHQRPLSNEGINSIEQVRLIEEIRLQKDAIQRAYSDEKMRNIELHDRNKAQSLQITALEAQIAELRSDNVRANDSEIVANRELDQLRERNN